MKLPLTEEAVIVNVEILNMKKFEPNDKAINIALPVLAVECEATPPIKNYLDAYEDTVLKLISIGLSTRGIAVTLNATESLIEEILDRLDQKNYAVKETGKPWKLTEDGLKYLNDEIDERESDNSEFGYMFVNAIKKEVLPYFYQGDINQISLYRGAKLPDKLTINGDEIKTFEEFKIKQIRLKEAYKKYFKNIDTSQQYDDGDITLEEAIDLFEGLDSFDEEDYEEPIEYAEKKEQHLLSKNMFIRALNCPVKHVYLTMRLIIDPLYPGGYRVESPFDFNGIDNSYFLRQIQWFAATGTTYIGDEELNSYLSREIRKVSPTFKNTDKDFSVFLLEKIPLLKINKTIAELESDNRNTFKEYINKCIKKITKNNDISWVIIALPKCDENEQKIIEYAKNIDEQVLILPLTMFDINSFRRLQNIMLRQIITLKTNKCPYCGGDMREKDNQFVCDNCNQLILTKTICPNPDCRHEYYYLSYDISEDIIDKMHSVDRESFYQWDSLYQYKDIINMSVESGKLRTICPNCKC